MKILKVISRGILRFLVVMIPVALMIWSAVYGHIWFYNWSVKSEKEGQLFNDKLSNERGIVNKIENEITSLTYELDVEYNKKKESITQSVLKKYDISQQEIDKIKVS